MYIDRIKKLANKNKIYEQKVKLFEKLKNKGLFWSYSKEINYEEFGEKLLIEYILKYADFDDIVECFKLFEKETIKSIWKERVANDKSFIKTNLMIARLFFGMDIESDYFKEIKHARFEKLRMLTT